MQNKYSLYGNVVSSEGDWVGWERAEEVKKFPIIFQLNQNYPNSFNPSTQIKYSIKEDCLVNIKIFDMLGNEVAILANEFGPAGEHQINFNANNPANGTTYRAA